METTTIQHIASASGGTVAQHRDARGRIVCAECKGKVHHMGVAFAGQAICGACFGAKLRAAYPS